jgi:molybdenum cofactor cytidylyltransferase
MSFAVIPAAGKSIRMGRPKLSLPLGKSTVLARVILALREARIDSVTVVVGPGMAELAELANRAGAFALQLTADTAQMRETVEAGLAWLESRYKPTLADDWLLIPADHPVLNPEVVLRLLRARPENQKRSIFLPTFKGQRGHPVLLSWGHVLGLRNFSKEEGINAYIRQQAAATMELEMPFPEVLMDLDTPADYERIRELASGGENPHSP